MHHKLIVIWWLVFKRCHWKCDHSISDSHTKEIQHTNFIHINHSVFGEMVHLDALYDVIWARWVGISMASSENTIESKFIMSFSLGPFATWKLVIKFKTNKQRKKKRSKASTNQQQQWWYYTFCFPSKVDFHFVNFVFPSVRLADVTYTQTMSVAVANEKKTKTAKTNASNVDGAIVDMMKNRIGHCRFFYNIFILLSPTCSQANSNTETHRPK